MQMSSCACECVTRSFCQEQEGGRRRGYIHNLMASSHLAQLEMADGTNLGVGEAMAKAASTRRQTSGLMI